MDIKALRDGVITNVISMVVGAIVLGAGTIVWNESANNSKMIGVVAGSSAKGDKKLADELEVLRRHVYELEESLINSDCYDSDNCTK